MSGQNGAGGQGVDRRKSESLRLRSTSASFTVDDLEVSLPWYRDVVGFTVKETFEHDGKVVGAELVAGSQTLYISQDDWSKGRDRVKGVGFRLNLGTTQDIDELAEGIKARGGKLASEPQDMPWGTRAFSLVDPTGFHITFASEE